MLEDIKESAPEAWYERRHKGKIIGMNISMKSCFSMVF
jgi:hypothetical protein